MADALSRGRDLSGRRGYDPGFLGTPVPLPGLTTPERTVALPYTHFTVLHRPDRRLAAVTALAMDGARLISLDREGIEWTLDPRLPAAEQAGAAVYARNDLDRGHLVRRASACWGRDEAEAEQANADTFHYPNAAPQAALFNQGKQLWLGLEEHVQEHAEVHDRRLVVLAGPVLDPGDPLYRDVAVPLRFWKVVTLVQGGALAATGYLLDQSPLVDDLGAALRAAAAAGDPPPLGAYRTFQVPIADIAAIAGVDLAALAAVDRLPVPSGAARAPAPGDRADPWVQLGSYADVRL
ncbi:DNA/RNA non-specific endonuclease [Blastococcus sp. TF02A-35]|uniref:DNA/RNA non-specific endonuclease n=1 Tax=Blastococcus sp. TF02A-35 TaxID=2559612 RepID=UPI00107418FC|nr:DNA/RNA non-specific endonuclease [Blastococcus sp. TF02A_35]TFV46276.1 DNA/RNA non-specific endonuclease [Blastococcus sp. TF02A_35]